jgi:hypothetical protein
MTLSRRKTGSGVEPLEEFVDIVGVALRHLLSVDWLRDVEGRAPELSEMPSWASGFLSLFRELLLDFEGEDEVSLDLFEVSALVIFFFLLGGGETLSAPDLDLLGEETLSAPNLNSLGFSSSSDVGDSKGRIS